MEQIKDRIAELLNKNKTKVDYLEIRFEESESLLIKFFGKSLDNLNRVSSSGGYIRSWYKGSWGFCSFNSTDELQKHVDEAISQSIAIGSERNDKTTLLQINSITGINKIKITGKDPRLIPLNSKVELINHYHNLMNSHSGKIK